MDRHHFFMLPFQVSTLYEVERLNCGLCQFLGEAFTCFPEIWILPKQDTVDYQDGNHSATKTSVPDWTRNLRFLISGSVGTVDVAIVAPVCWRT
jgi:hypothetical protein